MRLLIQAGNDACKGAALTETLRPDGAGIGVTSIMNDAA
jgi:hypothetical protein